MQTDPAPTRPYNLIQPHSPERPPQSPQEMNPNESPKQRLKIFFLICSSTFGSYFTQSLLQNASHEKFKAFNVYERTEMVDKELIMGYLSFIPLITGIMISHFGVKKTFRFFVWAGLLGGLLIVSSFIMRSYFLYLCGETLMKGSTLALWVAQIYMIIKWFKGKDLSLAIGVLGFSKSISCLIAVWFSSYLEVIGLFKLLSFGVILCVFLAANFMKKIDMVIKQEEEKSIVEDEATSLNHQSTMIALMVTIACFAVGGSTRSIYFSLMFPSHSRDLITLITKSENLDIFTPILLLPLLGSFVDRKNGRITGLFSSFILLFIGNATFYLLFNSDTIVMHLLASLLFQVGSCLFEVSFWAVLGYFLPQNWLGVTLGIALSLKESAPRFASPYLISFEKWLGFIVGIFLIIGIKSMVYAWVSLKKKEDFSNNRINNASQIITAEVN